METIPNLYTKNDITQGCEWVFDPSVEKQATELVEGIVCRVTVEGGRYTDVQTIVNDDYEKAQARRAMRDTMTIEDGTYNAVAFGPGIFENPLGAKYNSFYFWEVAPVVIEGVPTERDALEAFAKTCKSHLAPTVAGGIVSGIVWHAKDGSGRMAKYRVGGGQ